MENPWRGPDEDVLSEEINPKSYFLHALFILMKTVIVPFVDNINVFENLINQAVELKGKGNEYFKTKNFL